MNSLAGVQSLDRGGLDVLNSADVLLMEQLAKSNNTPKRALADPERFDGIGNAYSDEILHAAKLSPLKSSHFKGCRGMLTLLACAAMEVGALDSGSGRKLLQFSY